MNKFLKYIKENKNDDKSNIFPDPISDAEFRDEIVKYLLGEDFYIVESVSQGQANAIILEKILEKYL